jgi:hypothetical protein
MRAIYLFLLAPYSAFVAQYGISAMSAPQSRLCCKTQLARLALVMEHPQIGRGVDDLERALHFYRVR